MATDEINKNGGAAGYQIALRIGDDEGSPVFHGGSWESTVPGTITVAEVPRDEMGCVDPVTTASGRQHRKYLIG